jgi:FAD/FMN-containing dehydrogenase
MRPEVAFLQYSSPYDTDILQEYFVPVAQFVLFTDAIRAIFLKDKVNLLSVTIRYLPKNTESFLSYSRTDSFAFVLYLNQKMSDEGKGEAERFTRELIDATLQYGGTYYLPYQRYATGAQIRKAYPQLDAFIQKKAVYDPNDVFDNTFFEYYRAQGK